MPIPGYDPEDVDEALESLLDEREMETMLDDAEWQAYRDGEAELVDLLDDGEIERLLEGRDASTDAE